MMAAVLIIGFIFYNLALFWIDSWLVLVVLALADFIIVVSVRRLKWRRNLRFIGKSMVFVGFVVFCNIFASSLDVALLVGARLLLALEATYLISALLTTRDFAAGFYYLLYPLKLGGVDVRDVSVTIAIALSLVPILSREATAVRHALRAKGFDFDLRNLLLRPQVYVLAYVNGLFDRAEVLEKTLRAKGYE